MNLDPVLDVLRRRTGLDPVLLGDQAVHTAITTRLSTQGLDPASYALRLGSQPEEFARLIEDIVVPETWFLRGGSLFASLAAHIAAVTRTTGVPFRVLSLPCSTGEEPYSLALALAESGLPATSCRIDGIDLSSRAIAAARRGIYSELSFRQLSPALRSRYFRTVGEGWEIDPDLRQRVRYQTGNLLDPGLLVPGKPYDLVLCRNLFIYLTPAARRQGVEALVQLVAPGGLLALGHAEALPVEEKRFERTLLEGHLLYRKKTLTAPAALSPGDRAAGSMPVTRSRSVSSRVEPDKRRGPPPPPLPSPSPVPQSGGEKPPPPAVIEELLPRARILADLGQYDEAVALVRQAQQRSAPSAELYTLLGMIHQARHDHAEAGRCFRQALYLEPDHKEAIVHLMLLYQLQGAAPRVAALRRHLERLSAADAPEGGASS